MLRVVIVQYRLLHYRVALFEALRDRCAERGIELRVLYGQPTRREAVRRDTAHLEWADLTRNFVFEFPGRDVLWQRFPRHLGNADLVVLMQENRLLSNYPWVFRWRNRRAKVAYWGHGRNLQSRAPGGLRERWKSWMSRRVDWWFAYTELTRGLLLRDGVRDSSITVLNNAIDTNKFREELEAVTAEELARLRVRFDIGGTTKVGLFCGSLYADKKLDMLISAGDIIHSELSDFRLIVVGDGPLADVIRHAAVSRKWLSFVGVKTGAEKAAIFNLADVQLNPGAIGLHVLDAFCASIPLVTTANALHGPELAYLKDGVNGRIVAGEDPESYAAAVLELIRDGEGYAAMTEAAADAASKITLESMVNNFVNGIVRCLDSGQAR